MNPPPAHRACATGAPFDPTRNANEQWLTNPDSGVQGPAAETLTNRFNMLRARRFRVSIQLNVPREEELLSDSRDLPREKSPKAGYTRCLTSVNERRKRKVDGAGDGGEKRKPPFRRETVRGSAARIRGLRPRRRRARAPHRDRRAGRGDACRRPNRDRDRPRHGAVRGHRLLR